MVRKFREPPYSADLDIKVALPSDGSRNVKTPPVYTPQKLPLQRDPFEHVKLAHAARGVEWDGPRRVITQNTPNEGGKS